MKRRRYRPLVPGALGRLADCPLGSDVPRGTDAAWARAATDQWGLCGVVAVEDEVVVGHLLVCPTLHLPAGHPLAQWSRTPETAAVLELHVVEGAMRGTRRQLVQTIAGRLTGRVGGIEAAGAVTPPGCEWLEVAWAEGVGFTASEWLVERARLRLDMSSTLTWRPGLRSAWGLVQGWVEHPLSPEPSSRKTNRAR